MPLDRVELARAMTALAADERTIVDFVATYRRPLRAVVVRHLHALARPDLARDRDEVDDLVWEAATVLQRRAGGWHRDGGALPWTWAAHAIRDAIVHAVGHATRTLDTTGIDEGAGARALDLVVAQPTAAHEPSLRQLAATHRRVALWVDALTTAGLSTRDQDVLYQYRVQHHGGDPSPARTVAAMFGLSPANVRQIDRRARTRLAAVVRADDRFADLRSIPWLPAPVRAAA